jgi:hypothetical protein
MHRQVKPIQPVLALSPIAQPNQLVDDVGLWGKGCQTQGKTGQYHKFPIIYGLLHGTVFGKLILKIVLHNKSEL